MPPAVIEDPVINSPFDVPRRHFKFDDEGITNEIVPDATDADLLSAYPSLSPNDLAAAWQYYEANRDEIDEAIKLEEAV